MIETLITILIFVVVAVVIWYIVRLIAQQFGFPPLIVQLVGLVIGLILLLYAIRLLLPGLKL
jgi:hypothetical protein